MTRRWRPEGSPPRNRSTHDAADSPRTMWHVPALRRAPPARAAARPDPHDQAGARGPGGGVRAPEARVAEPDGHADQRVRRVRAGAVYGSALTRPTGGLT